jgi:Ala-tRNA(Pro) deacylase
MNEAALPTSPQQLVDYLNSLDIGHHVVKHPPLFTVEDSKTLRGELPGHHIKNLFLRDKRESMFLVVAQEDRRVDLKALAEAIGASKLSFGSAERLMKKLGVLPGAVTPFAVINDKEHQVKVFIDRAVMSGGRIHCHPLVNDMTVALDCDDLLRFLRATGHEPKLIDIPERPAA